MPVTVLLFIGAEGPGQHEQWVAGGRLAAAQDALNLLQRLPNIGPIIVATPDQRLAEQYPHWPVIWDFDPPTKPFHFGQRLADLLAATTPAIFFYYGAGSLPLLPPEIL